MGGLTIWGRHEMPSKIQADDCGSGPGYRFIAFKGVSAYTAHRILLERGIAIAPTINCKEFFLGPEFPPLNWWSVSKSDDSETMVYIPLQDFEILEKGGVIVGTRAFEGCEIDNRI